MKDKILSICIGTNNGQLNGSKNDSIIFFNFLYYLYENNNFKKYWLKPYVFFDESVNMIKICSYIKDLNINFKYLLIFYSGHGYQEGIINIPNSLNEFNKVTDTEFIKKISDTVNNDIELYLILDCCFGGSFKLLPYNRIKKVNLISSTNINEEASEGITRLNNIINLREIVLKDKLNIHENTIIMGIFTYNFIYILSRLNNYSIKNWKNVIEDVDNQKIWNNIKKLAKQTPFIKWE
mgnify:CR=1 FL=1